MSDVDQNNLLSSILYVVRDKRELLDKDENLAFFDYAMKGYHNYYGQNFQDVWVAYECDRLQLWKSGFYYVDFGATDGVYCSNSYYFSKLNWAGILAEPNPVWHDRLRHNRGYLPLTKIDKRCVSTTTGDIVEFLQTEDPHHSTIESFRNSDYNAENRQKGSIIQVETVTLYDLLRQHKAPDNITYLSIDTEGSEYDILEKFFEQNDRYKIKLITVEHNYNNLVRTKIHHLLAGIGYQRKFTDFSRWDDFYIKVDH